MTAVRFWLLLSVGWALLAFAGAVFAAVTGERGLADVRVFGPTILAVGCFYTYCRAQASSSRG